MIQLRKESDEVLYPTEDIILLQAADLEDLKQQALQNPRQRIRICAHRDPGDTLHEMFIVHTSDTYVRPHKHLARAESFSILEGRVDLVLFQDNGEIQTIVPMGSPETGLAFYYRLSSPVYHTLIIRSRFLVFHEVTQGPFNREQTVFADWSLLEFDLTMFGQADASFIAEQMKRK